jgi:hypothetical protein
MRKIVRRSENLNFKRRLSPFEDFMDSLHSLNGIWSRLNYVRELRDEYGRYRHWGLSRIHGEEPTEKVISEVHSELYLQLLRCPLQELFEQLPLAADDAECSTQQIAEQMCKERSRITPKDLRGGAPMHLKAVLVISDLLARHCKKELS